MEELILAGRITVNRMPAEIGSKVGPGDEVRINGEPVKIRFAEPKPRVLIYHKPAGEIVTREDPENRTTVFEDLPPIQDAKWIAVGRLDYNTEGLLLFTSSGELANRLMHPRYEVERQYAVRVMGRLNDEQMLKLTTGVELEDGVAKCEKVEDGGGDEEGANHWYHVVLKEGRNREVRRLFEALGVAVSRLIRTRYGRVSLPPAVKRGQTQELEPQEVSALMVSAGLRSGGGAQPAGGAGPRPQQKAGGKPHRPGQGKGPGGQRRPGQGPRGGGPRDGNREHGAARGERDGNRDNVGNRDNRGNAGDRDNIGNRERDGNRQHAGNRERDGNRQHAANRERDGNRDNAGNREHAGNQERDGNRDNRGNTDNRQHADVRDNIGNVERDGNRGGFVERDGNRIDARPDGRSNGGGGRPQGQGKPGGRPQGQGQGKFRSGKGQHRPGNGQGNAAGGYGGQRQPRLTGHSQPQQQPAIGQPQLTMHAQNYGGQRGNGYGNANGNPNGNAPGNRPHQKRFGKGGGQATPPKQRWEGLPKDEDEPQ
jgi:23S rRNA pseudouridine2605 synthase